MHKLLPRDILLLAVLGFMLFAARANAQLQVVELSAGRHRLEAEVAHTPKTIQNGLMHRRSLPEHRGMIFVYAKDALHCMWMWNTFIPLSVAFLDAEGRILNIEDMVPQTLDIHCAASPARFVLEMNRGWFADRGISPGMRISGIDRLPAGL